MAGSAGSIYVDLLLKDGRYRQGLKQSRDYTKRWSGQVAGDTSRAESAFAGVLNPVQNLNQGILMLGASLASALSVQQIVNYSDTWKQLQGRLGLVVEDTAELSMVNNELRDIAERTRQPLESIVNLYARMGQMIPENVRGSLDLLDVTEGVSTALAITGESSLSAQAAIIQFTQALSTNFEAAGQEIRSIQEQAPRLALALRNSFGDGTQSLKELIETGQITNKTLGEVFRAGQPEFDKLIAELERIEPTTRQAFTVLNNAMLEFVGNSKGATIATNAFGDAVRLVAANLETVVDILKVGAIALLARTLKNPISSATLLAGSLLSVGKAQETVSSSALRAAEAARFYNLESGVSERRANALYKAQVAAIGSTNTSTIAVTKNATALSASSLTFKSAALAAGNFGKSLLLALGPVNIAITALAASFVFLSGRMTEAEKIAEKYPEIFKKIAGEADNAAESISELGEGAAKQRLQDLKDEAEDLRNSLKKLSIDVNDPNLLTFADQIANPLSILKFKDLVEKIRNIRLEVENGNLTADQAKEAYADLRGEFDGFETSIENARQKTLAYITAQKALTENTEKQIDAQKRLNELNRGYTPISSEDFQRANNIINGVPRKPGVKPEITEERLEVIDRANQALREEQERAREKAQQEAIRAGEQLNSVYKSNRDLITGMTREEIARIDKIEELTKLLGTQYIPTQEKLNEAIQRYDESLQDNKENVNQWGIDISEVGKNAAESIQDAFADFLFDPFEKGTKGMLEQFGETIQRMLAEAAAADLMRVLFGNDDVIGLFGTGGKNIPSSQKPSGGGIFDGIGEFFAGFFADGGTIPAGQFGIVGERGPELAFGGSSGKTIVPFGGGGAGNVNVTVINNGNNNVSTRETQTANGMDIQVMIDEAVAQKISTPGSRTNRALNAYSSRGLVTR